MNTANVNFDITGLSVTDELTGQCWLDTDDDGSPDRLVAQGKRSYTNTIAGISSPNPEPFKNRTNVDGYSIFIRLTTSSEFVTLRTG